MSGTLADIALNGGWTPTNVLVVIVAASYGAVAVINALKGNPQQQDILQQLQGFQNQLQAHAAAVSMQLQQQGQAQQQVQVPPQLLAQALMLQARQAQQANQPAQPAQLAQPHK